MTIIMLRTEDVMEVVRKAIEDGRPACIRMPTELVYYTAQGDDRTLNDKIVKAIKGATKIILVANDTTWMCLGTSIVHNDVCNDEQLTAPPGPTSDTWSAKVGTLEE